MKHYRSFYIIFAFLLGFLSLYSCAQNTHNIEELSNKNSEYYYNIGMASLTAGNYAAAIANFKKAILKDQYNYKAYDKLALAYANVGNYKKAIKNIDKAINIKPDYYQAILDKAIILQANNKVEDAINTLNICIENDYCSLRPQAYYQLANIYKLRNDTKDYIKNLNLAILYDRDFNVAKFDLARAYVDNNMCNNKKIEEKVEYLLDSQKTNIGAESYPDMLLLKAKCYTEARNFKKASKLIQKILFKDDIPQKYKNKAIELSKELITLEYIDKYNNSTSQNIGFATNLPRSTSIPRPTSIPRNTRTTKVTENTKQLTVSKTLVYKNTLLNKNQINKPVIQKNNEIENKNQIYYQLG
ncbi:tetratricopeptide repeat protein, partial [Hydrogenobaculum acidophilum]